MDTGEHKTNNNHARAVAGAAAVFVAIGAVVLWWTSFAADSAAEQPEREDHNYSALPQTQQKATAVRAVEHARERIVPKSDAAPAKPEPPQTPPAEILLTRRDDLPDAGAAPRAGDFGACGIDVLVRSMERKNTAVSVEFLAGMNEGRVAAGLNNTKFAIEQLFAGRAMVRITCGKFVFDTLVTVELQRRERLEVTERDASKFEIRVNDADGQLIHFATADIRGKKYGSADLISVPFGAVSLTRHPEIFYVGAKGYETIRKAAPSSFRSAPEQPVEVTLRRSVPVIVGHRGLALSAPPPICVIVPKRGRDYTAFPQEKLQVAKFPAGSEELTIEGLACAEAFEIHLLSDAANAMPQMRELPAVDANYRAARAVTFYLDSPKTIWGRVMAGGQPRANARVTAESDDLQGAMEGFATKAGGAGGLRNLMLPILPPARKRVDTNGNGDFKLNANDLVRPATLRIESEGCHGFVMGIPKHPMNIGEVEIQGGAFGPPEGISDSSVIFEFTPEFPAPERIVVKRSADDESPVPVGVAGQRTDAVTVPAGDYWVSIKPGTKKPLSVRVKGATVVRMSNGEDQ